MTDRASETGEGGGERLKFRRHDDYAVDLFRQAEASLDDPARVDRLLLELGRFYNPYLNAPIVDVPTRRRVLEALAQGRTEDARRLLQERLTLYSRPPGVED